MADKIKAMDYIGAEAGPGAVPTVQSTDANELFNQRKEEIKLVIETVQKHQKKFTTSFKDEIIKKLDQLIQVSMKLGNMHPSPEDNSAVVKPTAEEVEKFIRKVQEIKTDFQTDIESFNNFKTNIDAIYPLLKQKKEGNPIDIENLKTLIQQCKSLMDTLFEKVLAMLKKIKEAQIILEKIFAHPEVIDQKYNGPLEIEVLDFLSSHHTLYLIYLDFYNLNSMLLEGGLS
ncbi:MAG: hypothetical protein WC254_06905 [Candidatus Woesearchaeota archaeon]|jgi:hypothetical protein